MELLPRVLVGITEVFFEVDGGLENLTVDFAGNFAGETIDRIGESVEALICSVLDLKIGFTFKGVFHADSGTVDDFEFTGSSAVSGVLEGLFDNFDNFG